VARLRHDPWFWIDRSCRFWSKIEQVVPVKIEQSFNDWRVNTVGDWAEIRTILYQHRAFVSPNPQINNGFRR